MRNIIEQAPKSLSCATENTNREVVVIIEASRVHLIIRFKLRRLSKENFRFEVTNRACRTHWGITEDCATVWSVVSKGGVGDWRKGASVNFRCGIEAQQCGRICGLRLPLHGEIEGPSDRKHGRWVSRILKGGQPIKSVRNVKTRMKGSIYLSHKIKVCIFRDEFMNFLFSGLILG